MTFPCIPLSDNPVFHDLTRPVDYGTVSPSYNFSMLINFVGAGMNSRSLTRDQSRGILNFCRSAGATLFTVNFVYAKGEESEKLMQEFYERFSAFSAGEKDLEKICGDGFSPQPCWVLDERSIEAILNETDGDLLAYDILHLPEDWVFYSGDAILLQIVTHEQEATLRLSEVRYGEFEKLGIPYARGCPRYSGLPEQPTRLPRRR
jgi:hypothetical protein